MRLWLYLFSGLFFQWDVAELHLNLTGKMGALRAMWVWWGEDEAGRREGSEEGREGEREKTNARERWGGVEVWPKM